MIADIWLDQVKFSFIITLKNLVKESCSMVTEFIKILVSREFTFAYDEKLYNGFFQHLEKVC